MAVVGRCSRSPASRGDRAAKSMAVEGGEGVPAAHMADLAVQLDQVDGLVAKDVLGPLVWKVSKIVSRPGSTDLAFLDEITDYLLPSSSG
ncbi:hypothetical protein CNMCM5623_004251 [Aspergillus felis]|uniref:Uncharacterized protein n=1 Tax=Aspergillus felis TaxID=1287682 RepID=A0A8H6QE52_9EURO|nr:hypothetical protein CNMCM5623_004251 [Aspergillus felis]